MTQAESESWIEARSYELDFFGHVNHAVHLNYFEQARCEMLARLGLTYAEIARRGWAIHVVRVEVDYLSEVLLGDRLRIRTWVDGFRRASMTLLQDAIREPRRPGADSAVAAKARVVAVWIGADGRPMRVPRDVRESLEEVSGP